MKNKFAIIGLVLLCSGSIFWFTLVGTAVNQRNTVNTYFESHGLNYEILSIPVGNGVELSSLHLSLKSHSNAADGSVPTLIHINGANNRKEGRMEYAVNLALMGLEVFVVEPRGHGQSGGHFTLYAEEPRDVSKVIDYISQNHKKANTTHVAVSGFSLGGGMMLLAQAIEPRIFCSVLYHPVTDLGAMMVEYGLDSLFGQEFVLNSPYASDILNKWEGRSAYKICTPENTEKLLIIQGSEDDTVFVEGSAKFINYINPEPLVRKDVQLVVRNGIGHGGNERDQGSIQYTKAWFTHFFFNQSVDLGNLETEAQYQPIINYLQVDEQNPELLFWLGLVLIQFGLYCILIAPKLSSTYRTRKGAEKLLQEKLLEKDAYFRMFLVKSGIILVSGLFSGLVARAVDPNVVFGLIYGIIGGSLLGLFLYNIYTLRKFENRLVLSWKEDLLSPMLNLSILVGSMLIGVVIYDWAQNFALGRPFWPWKGGLFVYPFAILLLLSWISLGNAHFGLKQWYYPVGLAFSAGLASYIYILFNPLPEIALIRYLPLLFVFAIMLIWLIGSILSNILKALYLKTWVGALHIGIIIAILALNRFMNLFL
jgi:dienelactone hydrolase